MKKIIFIFLLLPELIFGQATGKVISDKPSGGSIGAASVTVDVWTLFNLNQTTSGQTITIPNLTNVSAGKIIYINNVGTVPVTLSPGGLLLVGTGIVLRWDGVRWNACNGGAISQLVAGSGITINEDTISLSTPYYPDSISSSGDFTQFTNHGNGYYYHKFGSADFEARNDTVVTDLGFVSGNSWAIDVTNFGGSSGGSTHIGANKDEFLISSGGQFIRVFDDSIQITSNKIILNSSNATTITQALGDSTGRLATDAFVMRELADQITSAVAIPQPNIICVYSTGGVNDGSANRGDINKAYATPEYVVANITNTGTITVTTTSGSATLTGVSSTASISLGQYIGGTGVAYGSVVTAFTSSTIVVSVAATASGTITATWVTPYTIRCRGSFVITSNLYKEGFFYDFGNSTISFGNLTLFDRGNNIRYSPEVYDGGFFYGTHTGSKYKNHGTVDGIHDIIITPKGYYSIGTSYAIDGNVSFDIGNVVYINCRNWDARFGIIGRITNCTNLTWSGYKYGLLGGISLLIEGGSSYVINDVTQCPGTVYAITEVTTSASFGTINGYVIGGVLLLSDRNRIINANIVGSNFVSNVDNLVCNGYVQVTTGTVGGGSATFNGICFGTWTVTSSYSTFANFAGSFVSSSGVHNISGGIGDVGGAFATLGNITLTSTAIVNLNANDVNLSTLTPGDISVGVGAKLTISGRLSAKTTSLAGTLILNNTELYLDLRSASITGTVISNGANITLYRYSASESDANSPCIVVSTGVLGLKGGSLVCAVADSKSGLIRKTADGGRLILSEQVYLKQANGLAPLQILSNTGTAQDVFDFSVIDNCAVSFRLADTFTDVTYGTAYAPNLLIGGVHYEATTNTW